MAEITNFFKDYYLSKIQDKPELFIGIELEYPIVNKNGGPTSIKVAKDLLVHLAKNMYFYVRKLDETGNPIEIVNDDGDLILFEVTYNTLELAFAKAKCIHEVAERFELYLQEIQGFLALFDHELQGVGINPSWQLNDHRPVTTDRYKMLMAYLRLAENHPHMHPYVDYAGFICGNQVQFDVSRKNYLRVINAFNKIEAVKAFLFANSEFAEREDWTISRDYFWESSMHGLIEDNVGVYPEDFNTETNYLEFQKKTAIFYIERDAKCYYFPPITVEDFLRRKKITAMTTSGQSHEIVPTTSDLKTHRSYHYQELTKRGTIEFRSICTQPFDKTFAPIAFQLGLLVNLEKFEKILEETDFFDYFGRDYKHLRKQFSVKHLTKIEREIVGQLSRELVTCATEGLKARGMDEEKYLLSLQDNN
ncbi:TPA: glutamate-cysteine ligase family protein [Streptococcus suis]